jgi:hypothetical protein
MTFRFSKNRSPRRPLEVENRKCCEPQVINKEITSHAFFCTHTMRLSCLKFNKKDVSVTFQPPVCVCDACEERGALALVLCKETSCLAKSCNSGLNHRAIHFFALHCTTDLACCATLIALHVGSLAFACSSITSGCTLYPEVGKRLHSQS